MLKPRHGRIALAAFVLECFLSLGALGGGLALMLGPAGQIIPLPLALLRGSPFADYFWPGVILFVVLGVAPAIVATLVWRYQPLAPLLTLGVGLSLVAWLAVQISIIGYSSHPPLQPLYLLLGVAIAALGAAGLVQRRGLR